LPVTDGTFHVFAGHLYFFFCLMSVQIICSFLIELLANFFSASFPLNFLYISIAITEKVWTLLKKLKIELPNDLPIPLLGMYLKEMKSEHQRDTCMPMITVAPFTIAKLWNQSRFPSTDEQMKRM
jgi:hypothetical protein